MLLSYAYFETNVIDVLSTASPFAPNMSVYTTGCGVGIEAFASPIFDEQINPPFIIISGFTPNIAGLQRTRSAIFPTSTEPAYSEIPCVIAGFIVYFEIKRLIRVLSFLSLSSSNGPLCFFILSAVCHVRIITSPTRPIACESELIIENIPMS